MSSARELWRSAYANERSYFQEFAYRTRKNLAFIRDAFLTVPLAKEVHVVTQLVNSTGWRGPISGACTGSPPHPWSSIHFIPCC